LDNCSRLVKYWQLSSILTDEADWKIAQDSKKSKQISTILTDEWDQIIGQDLRNTMKYLYHPDP